MAEAEDVELVVKHPQRPCTQLLVSSIPVASAEGTWNTETAASPTIQVAGGTGCEFADRCPSATPPCRQVAARLFQTDRHRAESCYLYRHAPGPSVEETVEVFAEPARPLPVGVSGPPTTPSS